MKQAYEVHNPSFNDMTLAEQIEHGINDWAAEDRSGHLYFGRTKEEAEAIRASYNDIRSSESKHIYNGFNVEFQGARRPRAGEDY